MTALQSIHDLAPQPLSVPQLTARWGCSEGLIRKLIRSGDLQCLRLGALIRIAAAGIADNTAIQSLTAERDAALARVAALEAGLLTIADDLGETYLAWMEEGCDPSDAIRIVSWAETKARALLEGGSKP